MSIQDDHKTAIEEGTFVTPVRQTKRARAGRHCKRFWWAWLIGVIVFIVVIVIIMYVLACSTAVFIN